MTETAAGPPLAREAFDALLAALRPKLHRYCARMTGSVIDGEDVLQDAYVKALDAFGRIAAIAQPERWLFRIAHNAALDHLRRRARADALRASEDPEMLGDLHDTHTDPEIVAAGLRTFMRLPTLQRGSVILKDVLGYSLAEVGAIMDESVPAVKSALHRGRTRLRALGSEPDDVAPPALAEPERALFAAYVDRFNARDFDAVRRMLADEVRLELVARSRMHGRAEVGRYFHNYEHAGTWSVRPGYVDERPAMLVYDPGRAAEGPAYFVLIGCGGGRIAEIRDFRYAAYALEGARILF